MARTKRTAEETDNLIAELQTKAETAVSDLMASADWSDWLKWSSHFWQYSFSNQMMIFCQDQNATQVNSFKRWIDLGRCVRKGEKAIKIWAPITVKTNMVQVSTDDDGNETETPVKRAAFRLVSVFDINQTDGETEPPGRPTKGELTLNNPAVFEDYVKLWEALETKGVSVDFEQMAESIGGYYRASGQIIRINDKQADLAQRFRVLLHEAAHFLGEHKSSQDRVDKEVQAELAAYIAAGALGYDLGPATIPYVTNWAQDTKIMKANATATAQIAKALIQLVA